MNILFLGDIFARSGRDAVQRFLPSVQAHYKPDITIANVENAAHGFGVNEKIALDFRQLKIDVMTSGNHIFDKKEIIPFIEKNTYLLRPANYPPKTPGKGFGVFSTRLSGQKKDIVVINLMGRVFMDPLDDPFQTIDQILSLYSLKNPSIGAIFVDFHAETTSEKMCMAHYLDGRVTAVVGTHTHIPTADAQILPKGTAYQTDAGMCGDYNSVIGVITQAPLYRMTRKIPSEKFEPASGEATLCGVFITTDSDSGLAHHIEPIRIGPRLINTQMH